MILLVTGGCGFIGSNFIHYWLKHHPHDHVINLDSLTYAGNLDNLKTVDTNRYTFIYGDICDPDMVRRSTDGVDMIVHFAAETHVDHSIRNCQKFLITNVMGTYTLLEEVRRRGHQIKRFHHISTDEVFGSLELDEDRKFDERTTYNPKNPYSVSKASSDHLCRAFQHTYHLPITISNCTNNYGPYQFPEKLIPRMVVQALLDQPLTIHGDGLQIRDWIHVEDHARGIEAILERGNLGETYCFGGNAERNVSEVAKRILDVLGKPYTLLRYVEDRIGNDRRYAMNSQKAQTTLHWRPSQTFETGVEQTVAWYKDNEKWWRPLLNRGLTDHLSHAAASNTPTFQISNIATPHHQYSPVPQPSSSPSIHSIATSTTPSHSNVLPTPSMKILIFGKGYVASRMAASWPNAVMTDVRIDDKAAVLAALAEHQPNAVVNAAGKTGVPTADWCESHPLETFRSNTVGAFILAEACQEHGVYLLHLGTGCIFFGASPDPKGWKEDDFANPDPIYARSKYAADIVLARLQNVAIVRFRMPIDHTPSSKNLIDKLARYKFVPADVENSATILDDLVSVVYQLIQKRGTGIFHATNPGIMRHKDLIMLYREYVDPNHQCEWIKDEELVQRGLTKAKRANCIMQSPRLEELGIQMRPMEAALRETMIKYAANLKASHAAEASRQHSGSPTTTATTAAAQAATHKKIMKGVILAAGDRNLVTTTTPTNKHLLPLFDRPIILYALQTLVDAGIQNIMVVTGPEQAGQFIQLLGSGGNRNCQITYRIQDEPRGIAHGLGLAEDFVAGDNCTVILGDSVFEENFQPTVSQFQSGATIFYKQSDNAKEYGVVELGADGKVRSIIERPDQPRSNLAQVGVYIYDSSVFDIIRNLKPSDRGELEITDVNNVFIANQTLSAKPIQGQWWDVGTFQGMMSAVQYFSRKAGM